MMGTPAEWVVDGFAGFLLLVPIVVGFALGVALLIGGTRVLSALFRWMGRG